MPAMHPSVASSAVHPIAGARDGRGLCHWYGLLGVVSVCLSSLSRVSVDTPASCTTTPHGLPHTGVFGDVAFRDSVGGLPGQAAFCGMEVEPL